MVVSDTMLLFVLMYCSCVVVPVRSFSVRTVRSGRSPQSTVGLLNRSEAWGLDGVIPAAPSIEVVDRASVPVPGPGQAMVTDGSR